MERCEQEILEKNGGVCSDDKRSDVGAELSLSSKRPDPVSGSGERDADSSGICEGFDLTTLNPRLRARFERQAEEELKMTKKQREELVGLLSENRVRFDEPLKNHSSMGVGGPAEAFCTVENIEELKKLIGWASENDLEYRTWGGGTGTLVRDGGIRGVTLKLGKGFDFIETGRLDGEDIYLLVGAAMPTHNLVKWTVDNGFAGLEGLVGCCGTIGGNLITNAGTGVGVIGDSVEEITIINSEGRELSMKKSALRFEYRNLKLPRTAVIVRALLHLKRADANDLAARVNELSKKREETQPKDMKSLGCIFKNPGKTPAGVLIEEAGLKGVRVGGARVSTVHANFIVNEGKATARDVIVLMNLVRERVKEQSSAILEPEIAIVGDE